MKEKVDIDWSKSDVAMNAWLPHELVLSIGGVGYPGFLTYGDNKKRPPIPSIRKNEQ